MSESLEITPDGLRKTAQDLANCSSQMKAILAKLDSALSAEGRPWGDDDTGDHFAQGPDGYLAQSDWVNQSFAAKSQLLDQYSEQLDNTADTLQKQDET